MEDGVNGVLQPDVDEEVLKNGVETATMATFPEPEGASSSTPDNFLNGDIEQVSSSSESDALVIDERAPKSGDVIPHFNPYFNESLFELTQQHVSEPQPVESAPKKKKLKPKNSPKLREYAQYLGLQPTVQFRCSRCSRAGFESLTTLNEHIVHCTDQPLSSEPNPVQDNTSTFKLRRKVFLCSACGTYYENWNLYLHMIEVHRRYLCLYCLGMFSVLDDLCLHIQSRHNFEPGHKNTLEDFYSAYSDPCYIVCCECNKLFNEQENFFYHQCPKKDKKIQPNNSQKLSKVPKSKALIRPEDHVTGDSTKSLHLNGDINLKHNKVATALNEPIPDVHDVPSTQRSPTPVNEIIYSSDDELDFKGFNEKGEPVCIGQLKGFEVEEPAMEEAPIEEPAPQIETRKVPKLSLKLKPGSFPEIEHHEQEEETLSGDEPDLDINYEENEQIESENEEKPQEEIVTETVEEPNSPAEPEMQIAGTDISIIELELEQPLDKFDIKVLLQKCLKSTAPFCIYCNHARKIAVNGKQLGLHAIAEHRFSAVVSSITAEELIPESFVNRIKECLPELDTSFFSLEASTCSDEGVTFSHVFECFQCRFSTSVHKELYVHNRKLHAKNLLLCIMCKSNFYSYSELICHLCPGVYVLDSDVEFRCCMCVSDNLPSAFRLMVHLRKRHHVCDVCLEMCHSQYKLSSHVWKHKLHHFCYRCGIAYRNKPDITRHLFWKHGTESVLCKKCLQKKWPHVYHFCVPPTSFMCEECNLTFSKAVYLKVHKRIHVDVKPHPCPVEECDQKFISKKLAEKHEISHTQPPPEEIPEVCDEKVPEEVKNEEIKEEKPPEKVEEKVKPKVDVYDLPALNLSESDSSDSEEETAAKSELANPEAFEILDESQCEPQIVETQEELPVEQETEITLNPEDPGVVLDNIWDNFKTYQANKEKFVNLLGDIDNKNDPAEELPPEEPVEEVLTAEMVLKDHDYCLETEPKQDITFTEVKPDLSQSQSVDHDYCFSKKPEEPPPKEEEVKVEPKKKVPSSSSDSSSDSDSSCSCGSNCSCSSSSGSSSSSSESSDSDSSTEEGRRRQQIRREKRKSKKHNNEKSKKVEVKNVKSVKNVTIEGVVLETPIMESDLETTESETDEEFYDKKPQIFARKIWEEKRNQLLADIEQPLNGALDENRVATPNLPVEEEVKPKKKSKSKKKKKKKNRELERSLGKTQRSTSYYQYYQQPPTPTVAPITLTLTRNSPIPSPSTAKPHISLASPRDDADSSLRASKRRRVPNKFYGYSSDEEDEKASAMKWRKTEPPVAPQNTSALVVPPITIKTTPPVVQPFSIRNTSGQLKVQPPRRTPAIKLKILPKPEGVESEAESNDSSNESRNMLQVDPNALYCYCKCPYDEVSEMIGCDARDCSIEWFHFECVGIMVPPKGHWYCPECRKKRQQKRDSLKLKMKTN